MLVLVTNLPTSEMLADVPPDLRDKISHAITSQ